MREEEASSLKIKEALLGRGRILSAQLTMPWEVIDPSSCHLWLPGTVSDALVIWDLVL